MSLTYKIRQWIFQKGTATPAYVPPQQHHCISVLIHRIVVNGLIVSFAYTHVATLITYSYCHINVLCFPQFAKSDVILNDEVNSINIEHIKFARKAVKQASTMPKVKQDMKVRCQDSFQALIRTVLCRIIMQSRVYHLVDTICLESNQVMFTETTRALQSNWEYHHSQGTMGTCRKFYMGQAKK